MVVPTTTSKASLMILLLQCSSDFWYHQENTLFGGRFLEAGHTASICDVTTLMSASIHFIKWLNNKPRGCVTHLYSIAVML